MANPLSPVLPGLKHKEINLIAEADDIKGLPCLRFADREGTVLTAWKLTWRERLALILTGVVWIAQRTYWEEFQPVAILAEMPAISEEKLIGEGKGRSDRRADQPPS